MRFSIFQSKRAAVSFRNLPAQNQADSGAALLGGEERHEEIGSVGNARAFILNPYADGAVFAFPAHVDTTAGLQSSIDSIAQKVDEQLFELVRIGLNFGFRTSVDFHRKPRLQSHHAPNPNSDI